MVTLLCSPTDLQFLAVGFLQSQRLVNSKDDIKNILVDDQGRVNIETRKKLEVPAKSVITSSGAKGITLFVAQKIKIESHIKISPAKIFSLIDDFEQRCKTFKATGGTHSAALCDASGIQVFNEDIGRHNAIDKVFGMCLLEDISTDNGIMFTSGRVSSEILLKVASRYVPVLISRKPPTDLGIKLANDLATSHYLLFMCMG